MLDKLLNRMEIGSRLLEVRQELGFSQKEIGVKLDLPWRTYQNYEVGIREVSASMICKMYRVFNVDPIWLLLGDGQRYRQDDHQILMNTVENIERIESQLKLNIEPKKKAQVLLIIYEREKAGDAISENELENLVKLAG